MRPSLRLVVALAGMVGCGHHKPAAGPVRMSARDIVDASLPAIVRIEAGDNKVGTGFVLDQGGLIATNLHVIEGESKIKVRLYKDPIDYQVISIGAFDRGHDLALVRIKPPKKLATLRLGDSAVVAAGDKIYAIGNPLGVFDYSVSDGLISQVRTLSADLTILQISAPISQGSSGGPLFNQFGEVIGVTTAIITQGQSINLAVPGNYLRPMMKQPSVIALDEFAKATRDDAEDHGPPDDDHVTIHRVVPVHPVAVWDGCNQTDIEDVIKGVSEAIANGAPLYNTNTPAGYEACFRIYEGTALKWEHDARCKAVQGAFGDGLLRATAMGSYKEKAWAMRDTFDGLINASTRWCEQDSACRGGGKPGDKQPADKKHKPRP